MSTEPTASETPDPARASILQQANAERALAEAEARRKAACATILPRELGGRNGPEPTRFGDWEKGGVICDF